MRRSEGLVYILKEEGKGEEGEFGVGVLLVDDVFGQIDPGGDIVFDIVLYEFDEAICQYGLAIIHYEFLLLQASITLV